MTSSEVMSKVSTFLAKVRDGREKIDECVDLLYTLQKIKSDKQPPLLELISIIKVEKPVLFSLLKTRVQNNPGLKMLFEVPIDYDQAIVSLKNK